LETIGHKTEKMVQGELEVMKSGTELLEKRVEKIEKDSFGNKINSVDKKCEEIISLDLPAKIKAMTERLCEIEDFNVTEHHEIN